MIEVQRVSTAVLQSKLKLDIGGEHESPSATDCSDSGISQSERCAYGVRHKHSCWVISFFDLLSDQFELPANRI